MNFLIGVQCLWIASASAASLPPSHCTGPVGPGTVNIIIEGTRADGLPIGRANYKDRTTPMSDTAFESNFNSTDKAKIDLFRPDNSLWYSGVSIQSGELRAIFHSRTGSTLPVKLECVPLTK